MGALDNTKCECGHTNPFGTVLCESCGKPLDEKDGQETRSLDMRYEGAARRSQTRNRGLIDKVWGFFSSVKVAVALILITLAVSILGTILPQEQYIPSARPDVYYPQQYGVVGEIYYKLGLSDLYSSWPFRLLIGLIGVSLVVCSLDRVVPLYRALKNQRVTKDPIFLTRQRIHAQREMTEKEGIALMDRLAERLSRKRYHIRREGAALLAEKGRFSRWGPYINHVGLIIFLIGILLLRVPGFYLNEFVFVREGETKPVPQTPYYVKNEAASVVFYDPEELPPDAAGSGQPVVKQYETKAVLFTKDPETGELEPVHRQTIRVNHPLKYQDVELFQSDFQTKLKGLELSVRDRKTGKTIGSFTVDLDNPKFRKSYRLPGGAEVRILEYFPDFAMEENRPITLSEEPNRPAFVFELKTPELKEPEKSWVIAGTNMDEVQKENRYEIELAKIQTVNQSGLIVRQQKGTPIIFTGAVIFVIGLAIGFYWQHRRVWIRWKEGILYLGAHTNKNWFGFRRELEQAAEGTDLRLVFPTSGRRENG
ncbi:cytochrome c biogenesis protein ResB [Planifilum fimeticola]